MYVKICGNTSDQDVSACLQAGASALGFLVGLDYPSEDGLEPTLAAELMRRVASPTERVLVTHRSELDQVRALCAAIGPSALQLQGDFPLRDIPELRAALPQLRIVKAVHVGGPEAIELAIQTASHVDAVLVDSRTRTRIGGTGETHDWSISRQIRDAIHPRPLILAGGLRPDNLAEALRQVRPFGVDVNSGVSRTRGVKDPDAIRRFVQTARAGSPQSIANASKAIGKRE